MTETSTAAHRLYYAEPSLLEFTATITGIRELARKDGQQVWQISLDRTAFYPTSGGQPFDTGVLRATARSGAVLEVLVESVEEDDAGEVWHTTRKPLQEGTAVTGKIDAARRRDHMQQHSGQHLISALFDRELKAATFSFHLGEDASTIDLKTDRLTPGDLRHIQQLANELVQAALPLSVRSVCEQDASALHAAGSLRRLPARSGDIRLVEIPGVDLNACGGTHVATTAEIGPVLLRVTEKVRGGTRLQFLCGTRALNAAQADYDRITTLAQSMSTAPGEIAHQVAKLQAENKAAAKQQSALLNRLAQSQAAVLAQGSAATVLHRSVEADAGYDKLLASALVRTTPVQCALIISPGTERASVVLATKPGVLDCGTVLRETLATFASRGGGSPEMAQGTLAPDGLNEFLNALRAKLPAPMSESASE